MGLFAMWLWLSWGCDAGVPRAPTHTPDAGAGPMSVGDGGSANRPIRIAPPAGCDPSQDRDGDGIADQADGEFDFDGDGALNADDPDSDDDGIPDAVERGPGDDPCAVVDSDGDLAADFVDRDSDADGLPDKDEKAAGTDPTDIDSDGDGVTDFGEVRGTGTDPNDPNDGLPVGDFFVVLPHGGPVEERPLEFGTDIQIADLFFLVDMTGSMGDERTNLIAGLQTISDQLARRIPNLQFGVGGFDDYPVACHGGDGQIVSFQDCSPGPCRTLEATLSLDLPFYLLSAIAPFDADRGRWSIAGADQNNCPENPVTRDIGRIVGAPNGVSDLQEAVTGLPCHFGFDGPESYVPALYATATGMGLSWGAGTETCTFPSIGSRSLSFAAGTVAAASCPNGGRGYPCFRPGAQPIVLLIGDAAFHNGPGGRTYTHPAVVSPPSYPEARDALLGIGARVLGVYSGSSSSARDDYVQVAEDTGAVRADGSPLVFDIQSDGTGLSSTIVDAVETLVVGTPQDVTTRTENVAGNPGDVDATQFIQGIVPVSADPASGATGMDTATFFGVIPGTRVTFRVDFKNDIRRPTTPEIFRATIIVVGNGVTDLDQRDVWIVVPPENETILI